MLDHLNVDHLAPMAGITPRVGNDGSFPAGSPPVEVVKMPAQAPGSLPCSTRMRARVVAVTAAALLFFAVLAVVLIGDAVLVGLLIALLMAVSYGARHMSRGHPYARVQRHHNWDRYEREL